MIRLIKTNLIHLTFGRFFLIAAAAAIFLGCYGGCSARDYGFNMTHFVFLLLICAALTLLNLGREHSDGTVRNKLTLGFSRASIFFSLIISSLICSVVLYLLMSIPYFVIGKPEIMRFMSTDRLVIISLIILADCLLITVGSAVLALCVPRLPIAATILLAAAIGFGIAEGSLGNRLGEKKWNIVGVWDPSLSMHIEHNEQNPFFVSGTKRTVYTTLYRLDPYAQMRMVDRVMTWYSYGVIEDVIDRMDEDFFTGGYEFNGEIARDYPYLPLYSCSFMAVLMIGGVLVFRKININ